MSDEARKVSGHYGMCVAPGHPRDCPHCAERYERDRPKPTITEFLLARIYEDEEAAQKVFATEKWITYCDTVAERHDVGAGWHILRWQPVRVLAECETKRRIVVRHSHCDDVSYEDTSSCPDLRTLASVYADHPDYRDEWRL